MKISVLIGWVLLWLGWANPVCLCGHVHTSHQFDSVTPRGACQDGHWSDGCDCLVYDVKGSRPVATNRGTGLSDV